MFPFLQFSFRFLLFSFFSDTTKQVPQAAVEAELWNCDIEVLYLYLFFSFTHLSHSLYLFQEVGRQHLDSKCLIEFKVIPHIRREKAYSNGFVKAQINHHCQIFRSFSHLFASPPSFLFLLPSLFTFHQEEVVLQGLG